MALPNDAVALNSLPSDAVPIQSATQEPSQMARFKNWINTAPQRAEQRIASHSSNMADLINNPPNWGAHPLGSALRTIGGASELLEGIPSDIALGLGHPQTIPSDIYKTAMGQRPAQFGDVLTATGAPNSVATLGGLALAGLKGTPTGALGELTIGKPAQGLKNLIGMYGKPAIANSMKVLTGSIPVEHGLRALDNPDILDPKYLATQKSALQNAYKTVIDPLRNNPDAKVDVGDVWKNLQDKGWDSQSNKIPSILYQMKDDEAKLVQNWTYKVKALANKNNAPNYNDVEGMINKIDEKLGKFYSKNAKEVMTGKDLPSTTFDMVASNIRKNLSDSLKSQYPEAAPVIEQAHQLAQDTNAANSFKGMNMSFFKSILPRMVLAGGLGIPTKGASLAALPLTIPKVWGGVIRGAPAVVNNARYALPALRNLTANQNEQ